MISSENNGFFESGQVLLFDKPLNWTSFDMVNKIRIMIRSSMGTKKIKVGHAGTLDPLATGLLIICTGKATKRIMEFMDLNKEYTATLRMGATTPSFDLETEPDREYPISHITREFADELINGFLGAQEQTPPVYSAKFVDGRRAYEFARIGKEPDLKPVRITIHEAGILDFSPPDIRVRLLCSKGTYVRSFARDFGTRAGSGAYLKELRRTAIGHYRVEDAFTLEKFNNYLEQLKQS